MKSFIDNRDIDFLSPQLYESGNEKKNDYSTNHGFKWEEWRGAYSEVIPSIVTASLYADAHHYFSHIGINCTGYIQWKN
jgi:hypothetical protein